MSKLDEAFAVFHLEEGTTFSAAKRKYRQFVKSSHPDLMRGAEGKRMAEAYLKDINNLFEILEKHFRTEHTVNLTCHHFKEAKALDTGKHTGIGPADGLSNLFPKEPALYRTERNTPRPGEPSAAEVMAAAKAKQKKREDEDLKQQAEAEAAARKWRDQQASNRITQEAARQVFLQSLQRAKKVEDKK